MNDNIKETSDEALLRLDPEFITASNSLRDEFVKNENKISYNNKFEWDVYKDENINFFNPVLSYELSGYRPIDEERGLDFDPDWFVETRNIKKDTGKYCSYPIGSKRYIDFWRKEISRCNDGMIVNGYRITGDNYFFLNFYQLKDSEVDRAGAGRSMAFPRFFSKQYEYFHYIDLCERTRHDVCALKSRGVKACPLT